MVRFIITALVDNIVRSYGFTFQYGQIYYLLPLSRLPKRDNIYIPIWLDLLFSHLHFLYPCPSHLHSNMVRFIMSLNISAVYELNLIYIPIWLDLLSEKKELDSLFSAHLHSNMVRFIIYKEAILKEWEKRFTFQYGQIYYAQASAQAQAEAEDLHSNMVRFIIWSCFLYIFWIPFIYIPIWLDLLQLDSVQH